MKERPILFQGAMVRALLAGTKTQTRRMVKPQPQPNGGAGLHPVEPYRCPDWRWNWVLAATGHGTGDPFHCPYGKPGDRLWVRESFMHEPADYCWGVQSRPASTVYRADFPESQPGEGWKPSIHIPRKLSRIDLEVTAVLVERLQDISEEDAQAEGCERALEETADDERLKIECGYYPPSSYGHGYRLLWESINGPESWRANPWVWVIEFKRATS